MKRTVLLTAALVVLATSASALTIKNSKHDLSLNSGASWNSTNTNEICVFCHTPHNPAQNVPLWNRTNPAAGSFTLYKTSATLTTAAKTSAFAADSISLFCMSCHDGVTGLGAMTNTSPVGDDSLKTTPLTGPANIGIDLQNDHPVGFSYDAAQSDDSTGLFVKATANAALGGNAFFGAGANMIECASCHKVHDNANAPFLRTTNKDSALCLACHNK